MSAYRVSALVVDAPGTEPYFDVHPFPNDGNPDCPYCAKYASGTGKLCKGRRSFWSRRHLCPAAPHFHPRCSYCQGEWIMATKLTVPKP